MVYFDVALQTSYQYNFTLFLIFSSARNVNGNDQELGRGEKKVFLYGQVKQLQLATFHNVHFFSHTHIQLASVPYAVMLKA